MPSFTFTSPEGQSYTVNGPEGATEEQAWGILQQQLSAAPKAGAPLTAQSYKAAVAQREQATPDRSISDAALDAGISLLKGTIGLPESFVGLADIPTGGRVGKILEDAGFRPREARQILDTYLSEAQQAANRKVQAAEGLLPTIGTALQNPSTIATSVLESAPQMVSGAGIGQGILKAAPKVGAAVAAGLGEGVLGAGSAAEQTRGETQDKLLTTAQALSALGSGAGTAAFGVAGGRLANKLGLDDIDTMLVSGSSRGASKSVADFAKRAIGSGISEGVFEEMPQSAQEQMWANYAMDRPLMQGVAEAAGMGAVTGFAMGVGGGGSGHVVGRLQERRKEEQAKQAEGLRAILEEQQAAQAAAPAVTPEVTPATPAAPVAEDVNAPAMDREAMLKELEDQIAAAEAPISEGKPEEHYNKLQSTEAPAEIPVAEETPVAAPAPTKAVAKAPVAPDDLSVNSHQYDTPDLRLKQADAFGTDLTTALYAEMESHGRAALKNRGLTNGYAVKQESLADAADAATLAFGTNDYNVFAPYAPIFPKVAKKLQAVLAPAAAPVAPAAKTEEQYQQDIQNGMKSINAVREKRITQEQYEQYQKLAEIARVELNKIQSREAATLSPAQQEAIKIAERMEALGETSFPAGIRNAARKPTVESNLAFYREKLADLESKRGGTEQAFSETHSLKDLMKIESDQGTKKFEKYQQTAAPKTRAVVERAGKVIQQVKDAINAAGYAVNDVGASSPYELQRLKNLHSQLEAGITQILTQHYKLATGHKVSSQEALEKRIATTQTDINKASQELRRYAQVSPEIREQEQAITGAKRAADKAARDAGSLWTSLVGMLDQSEVRDIFSANPTFGQKRLQKKGGKKVTGAQVSDLVSDGTLDRFLPPDMRHDSPTFDETESTELIKQKVRDQDYLPFDTKIEIEQIFGSVQEAEKLVDEYLTIQEQNLELQTAADEQRESEISTRAIEPEVEGRPAEPAEGKARESEPKPAPELELAAPTEAELKSKQAEVDRLEKENARLEKEAEAKAKADAEREEFVLTGSNRPADEAAARGQKDIFAAAEEAPAKPDAKAKLTKIAESLLDNERTQETVGEVEYNGQMYESRQRTYEGRLFGSELQLMRDAVGNAKSINLVNEPTRILDMVLTGKQVGQGRDVRIMETVYTPKTPAAENELQFASGEVKELAKQYNGEIVYGNDDLGLMRAHGSTTGEPIYVPYIKNQLFQNDIEQFPAKSFGLKEFERNELIKAKQDLEAKAAQEHAAKPFLTIGEGVTGSKDIPGKVVSVAKGWAKMLKLTGNIHVMTAEEATANKDKFTGPHRALGYIGTLMEPGVVKKVGPDEYVIIVRKSTSTGKTLEVLAHELGHIHQQQVYENADVATKNEIIKSFNAWFRTARGGTAKELIESLRGKRVGRATRGTLDIPAKDMANPQYWFSFKEWYADQVSRWAMSHEKPVGVVEQFFAKLGASIKKFFENVKAAKFLPNETFAQYLDKVTTSLDFTPANVAAENDQMSLFARGTVEGAPPADYRNYRGEEMPPSAWDNPVDTKFDTFQYKIVDKNIDTKRVIENIKKAVGDISDKFNAYIKEELYHGRTAKGIHDFLQKELLPITKDMKAAGVTIDELDEYLHNRHAEEYNEHINKINPNPKLQDKGSGISTEQARDYLEKLSTERKATFEALAKQVDSIVRNTQDLLVKAGIEEKSTIDAWRRTFPFYVPLKRDELEYVTTGGGVGAGYGTRGGASKRATGSLKSVVDIFENIALQREEAVMKAEKARLGRALYGLAIQNPNPSFWLPINPDAIKNKAKLKQELEDLGLNPEDADNIAKEPVTSSIDKKTGMVKYEVNPLLRNSKNVFPIRINGKDRFIIFNSSDPRALRMVKSLNNIDPEQLGLALGTIGEVTRFMASVNTQYNPVFGAWNFMRDVQGAALNLTTTEIAGHEKEVLKGVWPALKSIYSDLRAQRAGKEPKGEWQELFEQYQKAGGATGYREQFSRGNDKPKIVERELKKLDRGNVRQAADAVFNWLSDYNDAMENAVRLSAFKVALDQGLSEDKAASLAKNLTVNFNRRGASSPTLQALYAFLNASVQGTKRLAETLKGPAGRKIVAGGMMIGAVQAIALAMAGYDDDEPPEFLKDKNLILPVAGGNYLIVPMPMGFNIFPGIGRLTTEYLLGQAGLITGAKSLGDKTLSAASLILDSFNPLGSGSLLQIVSPTAFDPLAAIQSNKDAFGRPISKEDRSTAPTPGFQRSREGASWFSKNLAEFLNYVSSPAGTKYTKGAISPTADQIDYLIGQYTGGVGREVMKTGDYVKAVAKGETAELPSYRVPIVGKVYGETTTPAAISAKFYQNVTELAKHENEIKQRMKNREDVREYRAEHPETRFINRANYLENQITQLNKQKKTLQEKGAPEDRIKKIDEQKTKLMQGLNEQIKKLQQ